MPKFESLKPVGIMVSTLSLQVRVVGSNPVMVHFYSSCFCFSPPPPPHTVTNKFNADVSIHNHDYLEIVDIIVYFLKQLLES